MKNKKAFTLAEILITLMLVGVVAALTIPMFIEEFQKNKWTVTYKRTFAETFNALGRVALEEECAKSLTCTHIFDDPDQVKSTKLFGDEMTKVMATSKVCGMENVDAKNGCFTHEIRNGKGSSQEQTLVQTMRPGTDVNFANESAPFYTFITQRGVAYALFSFGTNCLNGTGEYADLYKAAYVNNPNDDNNQMLSLCGFVIMDVNGKQAPNEWGRDVFGVWVTDRSVIGVYPFGGDFDARFGKGCNGTICCGTENSQMTQKQCPQDKPNCADEEKEDVTVTVSDMRGCAAKIVKDGWVMKY